MKIFLDLVNDLVEQIELVNQLIEESQSFNMITKFSAKAKLPREEKALEEIRKDLHANMKHGTIPEHKKDLPILADREKSIYKLTNIIPHSGVKYAV